MEVSGVPVDEACAICLEDYVDGFVPVTFACRHAFHKECM